MYGTKISSERILLEDELPGGRMMSFVLRRHQALRLVDREGGANLAALLYNRDLPIERYNMPDTLKAQHTAFLTKGYVLYSDMGRVLCSITEDTCGWHDTVTGVSNAESVKQKYGERSYQSARNDWYRNAYDELVVELAKWGLGARDMVPNINFFTKVAPDERGNLGYVTGHSKAGAFVDLRAEMNVLVVLSSCPHPLDPASTYAPKPVGLCIYECDPPAPDDPCRRSRAENERGFLNTERMFLGAP